MTLRSLLAAITLGLPLGLQIGTAFAQSGDELFFACATCHGDDGRGNPSKQAPNITGLNQDYVTAQMRAFADGRRGTHTDDIYGKHMTLLAPIYVTADGVRLQRLAAHIASLPAAPPATAASGNPETGAKLYQPCSVCHGPNGEGVTALRAPGLAGFSDWYLARQYRLYRIGARGSESADAQSMAAIASTQPLNDEQLSDIAAFLQERARSTGLRQQTEVLEQ